MVIRSTRVFQQTTVRRLRDKTRKCLSNGTKKRPSYTELPSPTWSIASLQLHQKHEPVSREELSVLAKRALVSIPILDSMGCTDQLRQDLGNMLHMIQQVQDFASETETSLTDADIYDRPRGVTAAPVHQAEADTKDDENNHLEAEEAQKVWESFLKPKTTAVGNYSYFVVPTKRERK